MRIARVFPRKTMASPDDELAFFDSPGMFPIEVDEVHVSVTFTFDLQKAERLAEAWEHIAPVSIGGPACGDAGGDFIAGKYLQTGYVITSRGCPNNCWFCDVPKREGDIRELPIAEGWILQDSNILACSIKHMENVFSMLKRQTEPVQCTGGIEAARLTNQHVSMFWDLRPKAIFFAYDTPDDLEPLVEAGKKLRYADFTRGHLRCYVLIGFPKDTFEDAEKRLLQAWEAVFLPFAMLYTDKTGNAPQEWKEFQRQWARPAIFKTLIKDRYRRLYKL